MLEGEPYSKKLLGLIISPKKIPGIRKVTQVDIAHLYEITDKGQLKKLQKQLKEIKKKGLEPWLYPKKVEEIKKAMGKTIKKRVQKELMPEDIGVSHPTRSLYNAILKRLENEPQERRRELFSTTIRFSIHHILESEQDWVRLTYITGNLIAFARNDNILDVDSAKGFIDNLEFNLYPYLQAMNPRVTKGSDQWNKITKAWGDIRRKASSEGTH